MFARRLQLQKRLTEQIGRALTDARQPKGVRVVIEIEAQYTCTVMRGVEEQSSKTITSAMHDSFRSDHETRDDFPGPANGLCAAGHRPARPRPAAA